MVTSVPKCITFCNKKFSRVSAGVSWMEVPGFLLWIVFIVYAADGQRKTYWKYMAKVSYSCLFRDVVVFLLGSVFGMIITKMWMDGLFNLKGYWDNTLRSIVRLPFSSRLCYWKLSVKNQRIVEASSHEMELTALKLLEEKIFNYNEIGCLRIRI